MRPDSRIAAVILATFLLVPIASRASAQDRIWRPYIELEGRANSLRHLGQGNLFLPLSQDNDELLFADFRGLWTNGDAAEGNWGLAYRKILPSEWIVGVYGFYDFRHSECSICRCWATSHGWSSAASMNTTTCAAVWAAVC